MNSRNAAPTIIEAGATGHTRRMHSPALAAANRRGIVCMSASMACFIVNDMLMKRSSESLPLAQLIFVRGLVACTLLFAVAYATGAASRIAMAADRRVVLRGLIDSVGSLMYLASLTHLPLANATAINLASPLVIALMAAAFLGERPGTARWLAILGGFAGVLLVVQPSAAGFTGWAWMCLAATLFHASRDLLTRQIDPSVPALVITLANAACVTLAAALWMALQSYGQPIWQSMEWQQLASVALAAALLSSGYWLLVLSMRQGEMSVVAPFRYVGLLTALLLGWVVWGDVPNLLAMGGIALLLMAGLQLLPKRRAS